MYKTISKYNYSCGLWYNYYELIRKYLDGRATEVDGSADALMCPSVVITLTEPFSANSCIIIYELNDM